MCSEWKHSKDRVSGQRYTHLCLHTASKTITWWLVIKIVFFFLFFSSTILSDFSAGGDFLCSFMKETFQMRSPFWRINSSVFGIPYFTYIMTIFNTSSRHCSLHINKSLFFFCCFFWGGSTLFLIPPHVVSHF